MIYSKLKKGSYSVCVKNIVLITSDIELKGEIFILLKIRITWNSPCSSDRAQMTISYIKSSDLYYICVS